MITKNQIKYYSSLRNKKFREKYKRFLAEGEKIVHELLTEKNGRLNMRTILATEKFLNNTKLDLQTIEVIKTTKKELDRISNLSTPSDVILEIETPELTLEMENLEHELSLYYEDIRDPGNLGTIIRTADWFGIKNIICSPESVDFFNPKVIQSTMGSINRINLYSIHADELIDRIKEKRIDLPLTGTVLSGQILFETELFDKGIIFFGNESKGLNEMLIKRMDKLITIPGAVDSGADSLNIGISTGIIGAEIVRQQNYSK